MLSRDKRAVLSSNLLGGKDPLPATPGKPSLTAVAAAPPAPPSNAEHVLYRKGSASASGFRPWYWSFSDTTPGPSSRWKTVQQVPTLREPGRRAGIENDGKREGRFWDMIEGRRPPPPAAALLGWRLREINPEAGTIVVTFFAGADFLNPLGFVQGGILGAMLDDTIGPAAMAHLGGHAFPQTLELKTSFLTGACAGEIVGRARVIHRGQDILFLEGTLEDEAGRLLATATATARLIDFIEEAASGPKAVG